jgi:cytochrome b
MKTILVWDFPTRLLHWAFAFSVSASLLIALSVDEDSPLFQLHMLFGLLAAFFVVVRVVWGVIGSKHAQFLRFPLGPMALIGYLRELFARNGRRFAGHNPGAAWAAIAMFALVILLVATGLGGSGEAFEDVHEVLAYVLLSMIGLHLAGLAWHTIRHRENIAASMVTGRKEGDPAEEIRSARPLWALGLLVGGATWVAALFINHDPKTATVRIPVVGTVVQLGEKESKGNEHNPSNSGANQEDDED